MTAIVPLNIAALRVNTDDESKRAGAFRGRTAAFDKMPYSATTRPEASTGERIVHPLETQSSPDFSLGSGVHLHWQLPDHFCRGEYSPDRGQVVFPHAPNRWLVIRYLSLSRDGAYGDVLAKCFIVESDYVGEQLPKDPAPPHPPRPAVAVPWFDPEHPEKPPFRYMGRVRSYEDWAGSPANPEDFLPAHKGQDGKNLYLTALGFVGPEFSAYYPECCSVFGFWDNFRDLPEIHRAIGENLPIQFKTSYQVIGWIQDGQDPLAGFAWDVDTEYNKYLKHCEHENVKPDWTRAKIFAQMAQERFGWTFQTGDQTLEAAGIPSATLCAGSIQEIVWDTSEEPAPQAHAEKGIEEDTVRVAVGSTTQEALSALLAADLDARAEQPDPLRSREYLLNALQFGLLNDLAARHMKGIFLDESMHAKPFQQVSGGLVWTVRKPAATPGEPPADWGAGLPPALGRLLADLNRAQKDYDQARESLAVRRKQLFMDWLRWIEISIRLAGGEHVSPDPAKADSIIGAFLDREKEAVVRAGRETGVLSYKFGPDRQVTGISDPGEGDLLAKTVYERFCALLESLQKLKIESKLDLELVAVPAPPFYLPADPVLLLEGKLAEPAKRNGAGPTTAVRLSSQILSSIEVRSSGSSFTLEAGRLRTLPKIAPGTPFEIDLKALVGEAALLMPSLARWVAAAAAETAGIPDLAGSLRKAQDGLFAAFRESGRLPLRATVDGIDFVFQGSAPHPLGWNAQAKRPGSPNRPYDPFLPLFLSWKVRVWPLKWNRPDYGYHELAGHFDLGPVDYGYRPCPDDQDPARWTPQSGQDQFVEYAGSVVLSSNSADCLIGQIDKYVRSHPSDGEAGELKRVQDHLAGRNFLSHSLSGLNLQQLLKAYVPRVAVQNLINGPEKDVRTAALAASAGDKSDSWYDDGFNGERPIHTGLLAQHNFGPLLSGPLEIVCLEIVDVFGQRMTLKTTGQNADGALQAIAARSTRPDPHDQRNRNRVFLPPRLLVPTRLWFRWLSAQGAEGTGDFVEMHSHPATSPVCGWVLPNHLDNSLFFYDAGGAAVGSLGVEHQRLTYRTRAGNTDNPHSELDPDIRAVNPHLAQFIRYLKDRTAGFLKDLMAAILRSDKSISPESSPEDASLAAFIGRPLAITRAVLALETAGAVLPLSQADSGPLDAFPEAVKAKRCEYAVRQQASSANLGNVHFPVRLGSKEDRDDGLVGYLVESDGAPHGEFYSAYSAAAPNNAADGVAMPSDHTIHLTLNAEPLVVTMLVDPRADIHATTGVLPVAKLDIPPDQYSREMGKLAMTFFTHPVLSPSRGLLVPLPQESGYAWQWITFGGGNPAELKANAVNDFAAYGYSPQEILEGWLRLLPVPAADKE